MAADTPNAEAPHPRCRPAGSAQRRRSSASSNPTNAVAWVCPELGANVVAFAVRTADGWRHVLHQDGPAAVRERPSRFGLPILFPFPGHMVGGRYRWRGVEYVMPMLNPSAPSFTHGFAHMRPWRVTRQDESSLTAVLDTRTDLEPAQRAGYPFDLTLTLDVALAGDALTVTLVAENVGRRMRRSGSACTRTSIRPSSGWTGPRSASRSRAGAAGR